MKPHLSTLPEKLSKYRIYLLIAFPIVLFNLIAIFGVDVLLKDDAFWYNQVIKGIFPMWFWKTGFFLVSFTEWTAANILTISPQLIRFIYVLFLMVPISCLFYNLLQKRLGFPVIAAYASAVLPNILPAQSLIPAFTNGSYVLLGLLVTISCIHASFNYLDNQKKWKMLMAAVLLYTASTQLMEHSVFFLPVLLFAVIGYHKFNKKHLFLAVSFFLAALVRITWTLLIPRGQSQIAHLNYSQIIDRIEYYFSVMLPLPKIFRESIYLAGTLSILILITGLILFIIARNKGDNKSTPFAHLSYKKNIFYVYGFLLLWTVSHLIVFVFISRGIFVRYSYIAAYGLNALLVISLYSILNKIFYKRKYLIYLSLSSLILISGFSRSFELKTHFSELNNNQSLIIENLNRFKFPVNSQIVIYLDSKINFWGVWPQSSGHLKYMLKRNDIDGLIGAKAVGYYFDFYNPFNPRQRGVMPQYRMRGLNIKRSLFLFVQEKKKFKQYEYALQWEDEKSKPKWVIYHFDKETGKASSLLTGIGTDEYYSALESLKRIGISQKDILWSGPPTINNLNRLNRNKDVRSYINEFRVIDLSKFRFFSSNQSKLISESIKFGDDFHLLNISSSKTYPCREIIYFLWKSLKKQKIDRHKLAIILLTKGKNIWGIWPKFCQIGLELESGDYVFGSVKIPANKFREADHMGIRLDEVPGPPQWISLKIQGNHKTDQDGFRLLIPTK